jgi:hypothetical protein
LQFVFSDNKREENSVGSSTVGADVSRYARQMRPKLITSGEVPHITGGVSNYWVRLWTPPIAARSPWFVDEWEVSDASDVLSVIEWAREQAPPNGSFEVFIEHTDHAFRGDSEYVSVKGHIRVYGAPAESGGVTEEVIFTAN